MKKEICQVSINAIVRNISKRVENNKVKFYDADTKIKAITQAKKSNLTDVAIRCDEWSSIVYKDWQYEETLTENKELRKSAKQNITRYNKDLERIKQGLKISAKSKKVLKSYYEKKLENNKNIVTSFTKELDGFTRLIKLNNYNDNDWVVFDGQSIKAHYYPKLVESNNKIISEALINIDTFKARIETLRSL